MSDVEPAHHVILTAHVVNKMEDEEDGLTILGDDMDAILDVLEQDEFLQEEFSAAVNSVSAENLIFLPEFATEQF